MYFRKMVVSSELTVQEESLTPLVLWFMFVGLASQPIGHGVLERIKFTYSFILNNLWSADRDTKSEVMSLSLEDFVFFR